MSTTSMMMKTRAGAGRVLEVKAANEGIGEARVAFAQLNVVDHDRDYTVPGAFEPGQQVKVCQTGHAHGALPIGAGEIVGEIEMDGGLWAVADVKLFTDTQAGKDTHTVLKRLAELGHAQEWSYGYDIIEAGPGEVDGRPVQVLKRLSVYEVSPVLRGAGIGTHTVDVKSGACPTCGAVKGDVSQAIGGTGDGEQLPEIIKGDDVPEACEDCGKSLDECDCADAKGRATQAHLQWLSMKARGMSRRPVH